MTEIKRRWKNRSSNIIAILHIIVRFLQYYNYIAPSHSIAQHLFCSETVRQNCVWAPVPGPSLLLFKIGTVWDMFPCANASTDPLHCHASPVHGSINSLPDVLPSLCFESLGPLTLGGVVMCPCMCVCVCLCVCVCVRVCVCVSVFRSLLCFQIRWLASTRSPPPSSFCLLLASLRPPPPPSAS